MLRTLNDIDIAAKRVLVRCDFNVPIKNGEIKDDTRIRESLPTIKELLKKGGAVILMSHLGRPGGKSVQELSLKPVADRLSRLLGVDVQFLTHTTGEDVKRISLNLSPGEVLLIENLRFNAGEEANDPQFAKDLAELADVFVQDAFGTVHRRHASMVGVSEMLPSVAGELLQKEIEYLSKGLQPDHPFVVCLGGAKIATKIGIIKNMMDRADTILIAGGMAYTLLKTQGVEIGNSLLDESNISTAEEIMDKAAMGNVDLILPLDYVVTDNIETPDRIERTTGADIPSDLIGADIGEKTIQKYSEKIAAAKTIVLNGPMGVFETEEFSRGTYKILEAIVKATSKGASSIVGGGDTVSAIKNMGFKAEGFTHISTGGGASLKFLEGAELPGIKVLEK